MTDYEAVGVPPQIQTLDFSLVIGTSPVSVFPAGLFTSGRKFFWMRIINVSSYVTPSPSGFIWLSRSGTAAVAAAGSFLLAPGDKEEFHSFIPTNQLSAVASVAGTALTVELA
jgi:hypothetical protein